MHLLELKSFAVKQNWLKFHATIVRSEYDFNKAIVEQLKVDTNTKYLDGILIITKGASPENIINVAVSSGDKRIILMTGILCKKKPAILEKIEIENFNWQEILFEAIKNGNKISDGIKDTQKICNDFFESIIGGKKFNENLL